MFPVNQGKSLLALLIPALLLLATAAAEARGQRGSPMRDQVRAIQRAELNRILLMAVPAKADTEANRVALAKQIREDFKDLQALNNKMMAEAWSRETLDYSFVADMVSHIRGKAVRLKSNLSLPNKVAIEKTASDLNVSNGSEFRAALLILDRTIMSFVNNPVFREPKGIEINQATKARQDLESVIDLTADLKKIASSLAKTSKSK